jgi:hypothetical protein
MTSSVRRRTGLAAAFVVWGAAAALAGAVTFVQPPAGYAAKKKGVKKKGDKDKDKGKDKDKDAAAGDDDEFKALGGADTKSDSAKAPDEGGKGDAASGITMPLPGDAATPAEGDKPDKGAKGDKGKKGKKGKGAKGATAEPEPPPPDIALFPSAAGGKKGAIEILCFVPGADIYVEDKLVGKTPMEKPFPIPAGKYTVKVKKPGFSDFIDVILIPPGDPTPVEVNLIATAGYLVVTSDVAETQVTIDGTFVGTAPYEGELLVGTHEIRISKLCYKDRIESIATVAGTEYRFDTKMEELPPALNPCVKKDAVAYTPFYKRLWFPMVAGGAAAAIAAGIVVALLKPGACVGGVPWDCPGHRAAEFVDFPK